MKKDITIGVDMGDRNHNVCILDGKGEILCRDTISNTNKGIRKFFRRVEPCLVALEAGTHSAWVSRLIEEFGHEVLVGNPRKLRAIWDSDDKCDERDAEMLARIARFDRHLLYPIQHRGQEAHSDLAVIKARDTLVRTRVTLVSHARGAVKATGNRISSCSVETFHNRLRDEMPEEIYPALEPVMNSIEELTIRIRHYDRLLEYLCSERYPETKRVRQISGVGPVTALAFILTIEKSDRFKKSRSVGAYLGLTPKRDQSGEVDKQLRITKAGNSYLRRLLVGCSQYILGNFGPDCDLKQFGQRLASQGNKKAKRRAAVAVARKLSVLMHHLWKSNETYEPFHLRAGKQSEAA